jgi:hypothetical protein
LCSTTHHFLQKIRRKEENEIYVSKNSKEWKDPLFFFTHYTNITFFIYTFRIRKNIKVKKQQKYRIINFFFFLWLFFLLEYYSIKMKKYYKVQKKNDKAHCYT